MIVIENSDRIKVTPKGWHYKHLFFSKVVSTLRVFPALKILISLKKVEFYYRLNICKFYWN